MARRVMTWAVVPIVALAVLLALYARLGVIETITVAALVSLGWSLISRVVGAVAGDAGGSRGARD